MAIESNKPLICPVLIGREQDLTDFRLLVDRVKSGQGQVALLSGEAGIGKSRLVAEIKSYASVQGFLILEGQCFQTDSAYPYAPLLDLFRAYFVRFTSTSLPSTIHSFASTLSRLLPELALQFPNLATLPAASSVNPEEEKRWLFAAITHFVTEQAAQHPILLVVEDIHWCDDLSLDLLLHLARRLRQAPLLLLVTYRSEDLHPRLRRWLTQLDRERLAQEYSLARLTRAAVGAMLQAMLETQQEIDGHLLATLYAHSEGNPFFVEELLTSLMTAGELVCIDEIWKLSTDRTPVPRSVQQAVQQRTAYLSEDAKRLLTFAAVAGRRFNVTLLQEVMHCDEALLLALLKELIAAQLVIEEATDQFAFRHALTQQAILSSLLLRERRALHRTIAERLEQLCTTSRLRESYLEDLTYHSYEAGMWEQALAYAQEVGEKALMLYAQQAAIDHFTRAVEAAHQLSRTPPPSLYFRRGQAYEMLGEFEQARRDYAQALHLAQETQDRLVEWQCLLALGFLWASRDYTQAGSWFRDALTLASTLADPALQARSLNRLGNWLVNTGQPEEGLQAHREALALFETMEDRQGMAETLDLLAVTHGLYSDLITSVKEFEQAIDLFRALNHMPDLISSLTSHAAYAGPSLAETTPSALLTRDECLRDTGESIQLARRIDSPAAQAYAEYVSGMLLASFGEFGAALAHAHEALRLATEVQHHQWMAGASSVLGRISFLLLDAPAAIRALAAGLAFASHLGSTWWMGNITAYLALAYLLSNEPSRAEALLEASLPDTQPPRTSPERRLFWARGELALAQGHPDIALQIADTLLVTAPGAQSTKQPIPWLLKLKGEALAAQRRTEEAIAALSEAERGALQRQEQALLWRIHRAAGYAHRHLKQEELAQHHFRSARQGIASLASTIDDGSLHDRFLQAAQATLPREKPIAAKHAFGGLTAREREVVTLIAQGKSNREIAEALVVAKITVETHVNNILHKLGLTSRAQIVLWAVERGLAKH